jgi:predicted nucleic acid-binding protein
MTESLVVDASAALGWLRSEPRGPEVLAVLVRHQREGGRLLVPEPFWLEIMNSLVRRHGVGVDGVLVSIRDLDALGIETAAGSRAVAVLGLDLMVEHGLSAYDAAYLALALAENARLLTLDEALGRAAGDRSAIPFGRALHEGRERYRSSSAMEIWATHGAYLAELRRDAEAGIVR